MDAEEMKFELIHRLGAALFVLAIILTRKDDLALWGYLSFSVGTILYLI